MNFIDHGSAKSTSSAITCRQRVVLREQVALTVSCTAPFLQSPKVQLGYTVGGQVCNQNLLLPITATKFFTPPEASVPREAFFSRWRGLTGDYRETSSVGCMDAM